MLPLKPYLNSALMLNFKKNILRGGAILLLATGCTPAAHFTPTASPNPWNDNYKALSGIKNHTRWGTYNVHDPAGKKIGDTYYLFSTDAIYGQWEDDAAARQIKTGHIQVRCSKDLVNWTFEGWAFDQIPPQAQQWVQNEANGEGATNIWAPYLIPYQQRFRLYYCVSAFGRNTSYIGMAEAESPLGPWTDKGCVVKTGASSAMNAIDPSVIEDAQTGKWWMHYGSYFGGLYAVELNPQTGLAMTDGDHGHLIARRANYRKDNLEAPEIMYHPELKKYFLFVSYEPLMTSYNVRVGVSDKPEGPFTDYFGVNLADTTNNLPLLTAPYRFRNHPGWAGPAHCGVFSDGQGNWFMTHQGRLSPENHQMILHVRQLFFTPNGWPVVSPQRYAGTPPRTFSAADLPGKWEIIQLKEPDLQRKLEAGQVLWGEGHLLDVEVSHAQILELRANGTLSEPGSWSFDQQSQQLNLQTESAVSLKVFAGHDWENQTETILLTGINVKGHSVWAKKIK